MKPCPYCALPMSNPRRVQCGKLECKRQYRNARSSTWQRDYRERHGHWASTKHPTRRRKSNPNCVDCGAPVRHGGTQETRCRKCGQRLYAERQAGQQRREFVRRRAQKRLVQAAQGVARGWVFVSGACHSCGMQFTCHLTNDAAAYCSRTCARREGKARRRALEKGCTITPGRRWQVYERDAWICQICGDPVDRDAVVPALDAPVIDHIVPLAQGGPHALENWQTAHFYCNSVKRDQVDFDGGIAA